MNISNIHNVNELIANNVLARTVLKRCRRAQIHSAGGAAVGPAIITADLGGGLQVVASVNLYDDGRADDHVVQKVEFRRKRGVIAALDPRSPITASVVDAMYEMA